jgi:hypothetical protein
MLDLVAQEDAAAIAGEYHKEDKLLVVLNRVDGRIGAEDSIKRIMSRFGQEPLKTNQRVSYSRSHVAGRSGPEIDREAAREIRSLWSAIEEILRSKGDVKIRREPAGRNQPRQ